MAWLHNFVSLDHSRKLNLASKSYREEVCNQLFSIISVLTYESLGNVDIVDPKTKTFVNGDLAKYTQLSTLADFTFSTKITQGMLKPGGLLTHFPLDHSGKYAFPTYFTDFFFFQIP